MRTTTSPVDWVALVLLTIMIVLGIIPTVEVNLLGGGYDYRMSVALWFRGLLVGDPDVPVIAHAPLIYQIHVTAAWPADLIAHEDAADHLRSPGKPQPFQDPQSVGEPDPGASPN